MRTSADRRRLKAVTTTFLLCHRHSAQECCIVFASWKGSTSPLRRQPALASCVTGGHAVWWIIPAADEQAALAYLPPYVAMRTEALAVREVIIP